ncbi:hypothetical protein Noda2021_03950 [Candidatus Dependentiae bacterium Noda2021]|nr:hypothetical protein Noda2021_03950 [Candidatus Dependentiae bacterium Noda2021]
MSNSNLVIIKRSGERELFNSEKFKQSLLRAGAPFDMVSQIMQETLATNPRTTKELYKQALWLLSKYNKPIAARYNLKHALLQLGPAGFPFEDFVAQLFNKMGYETATGQIVHGLCVSHEIDVLAYKHKQRYFVECKFHNSLILKSDIKVALYVKARFDDLKASGPKDEQLKTNHQWIVTNTSFTNQAIAYAQCVGINLMGWSYPRDNSLAQTIDRLGLHPITALTSLSQQHKEALIQRGLVLCNQAAVKQTVLSELGFSPKHAQEIVAEAQRVCHFK